MAPSPRVSSSSASALLADRPTTATLLAPMSPFLKKERRLNELRDALRGGWAFLLVSRLFFAYFFLGSFTVFITTTDCFWLTVLPAFEVRGTIGVGCSREERKIITPHKR